MFSFFDNPTPIHWLITAVLFIFVAVAFYRSEPNERDGIGFFLDPYFLFPIGVILTAFLPILIPVVLIGLVMQAHNARNERIRKAKMHPFAIDSDVAASAEFIENTEAYIADLKSAEADDKSIISASTSKF